MKEKSNLNVKFVKTFLHFELSEVNTWHHFIKERIVITTYQFRKEHIVGVIQTEKNQNFLMLSVIFTTGKQSTQVMKKRNHLNVSFVEQVLKRKTSAQTTLRKIKPLCQQSKVSSLEND